MKFSIVVPTYNRAHLIKKTLQSLLDQTYKDFEVIVVDDGSTDETESVVCSLTDVRIFYYKKNNAERATARNFGSGKATGEYVNFFDSDDLAYPNHLQCAYNLIQMYDAQIFALNYVVEDENGKLLRRGSKFYDLNRQLIFGNLINCTPVFVKKNLVFEFPFDEDKKLTGSEDYLLWLKLSARFHFYYSNEITSALIHHSGRSVLSFDKESLIQRKLLMLEKAIADNEIKRFYGKKIKYLKSNTYSYISLHLAIDNHKKESIFFFKKAVNQATSFRFAKRFLTIIKNLFF